MLGLGEHHLLWHRRLCPPQSPSLHKLAGKLMVSSWNANSMCMQSFQLKTEILGKFGTMWSCLTFTICLFPAPINSLRTSLPGKLRLAPHALSPGWHVLLLLLKLKPTSGLVSVRLELLRPLLVAGKHLMRVHKLCWAHFVEFEGIHCCKCSLSSNIGAA